MKTKIKIQGYLQLLKKKKKRKNFEKSSNICTGPQNCKSLKMLNAC